MPDRELLEAVEGAGVGGAGRRRAAAGQRPGGRRPLRGRRRRAPRRGGPAGRRRRGAAAAGPAIGVSTHDFEARARAFADPGRRLRRVRAGLRERDQAERPPRGLGGAAAGRAPRRPSPSSRSAGSRRKPGRRLGRGRGRGRDDRRAASGRPHRREPARGPRSARRRRRGGRSTSSVSWRAARRRSDGGWPSAWAARSSTSTPKSSAPRDGRCGRSSRSPGRPPSGEREAVFLEGIASLPRRRGGDGGRRLRPGGQPARRCAGSGRRPARRSPRNGPRAAGGQDRPAAVPEPSSSSARLFARARALL